MKYEIEVISYGDKQSGFDASVSMPMTGDIDKQFGMAEGFSKKSQKDSENKALKELASQIDEEIKALSHAHKEIKKLLKKKEAIDA